MIQSQAKKVGECEVCDKTAVEITCHYGNLWFCEECWAAEAKVEKTPETMGPRIMAYQHSAEQAALEVARQIDNSIEVRTDIFNAATAPILDLKKSIDENPEIANKPYALAEELKNRFNHYQTVIFEANEKIVEAGNNQKAIQVYLNQLANTLKAEEREKLKIADINYKPTSPKPTVKKVSTTQTRKSTKLDKVELRKYAAELGVAEFTLQMVVVSKGISIEEAANILRRSINEAKSEVK